MEHLVKWYDDFGELTIDEFVKEAFFSNPEEMQRFEQLINLIPENARSILDVGCGPGVFLYLLKEKRKEIKEIGIEISENQIRYANNVLGVKVQYGSADDLKFSEKSFDVVTALEVLEHLPYEIYERACIEISRVAKSTIIISVPYNEDRGFIMCPVCRTTFNPNYHIRSFDEEILKVKSNLVCNPTRNIKIIYYSSDFSYSIVHSVPEIFLSSTHIHYTRFQSHYPSPLSFSSLLVLLAQSNLCSVLFSYAL